MSNVNPLEISMKYQMKFQWNTNGSPLEIKLKCIVCNAKYADTFVQLASNRSCIFGIVYNAKYADTFVQLASNGKCIFGIVYSANYADTSVQLASNGDAYLALYTMPNMLIPLYN